MSELRLMIGLVLGLGLVFGGCSCNDDEPSDDMDLDASMPDGSAGSGGSGGSGGDSGTRSDAGDPASCLEQRCAEEGESCDSDEACYYAYPNQEADPRPVCIEAGSADEGEDCTSAEDCAPGLGCDDGMGGDDACHAYCCEPGTQSSCPDGQACHVELTDGDGNRSGIGLCRACDACDPLTMDGCEDGEGCYPVTVDSECRLCQTSASDLEEGDLCETSNDCAPGLGCYTVGKDDETLRCRAFCDLEAEEGPCSEGLGCRDSIELDDPDFDHIGLCIPEDA